LLLIGRKRLTIDEQGVPIVEGEAQMRLTIDEQGLLIVEVRNAYDG
jgi:hypothetical protein